MNIYKRKKEGYAFFIAILAGIMILALSGVLLDSLNNELKTRKVTEDRITAKYLAEAGIEHSLYVYNDNIKNARSAYASFPIEATAIGTIGSYSVICTPPQAGSSLLTFQSTGINSNNKSIKITAQLDMTNGIIQSWIEE